MPDGRVSGRKRRHHMLRRSSKNQQKLFVETTNANTQNDDKATETGETEGLGTTKMILF